MVTVQENLTVPYHQQDNDVYCGVASAQMVLDSIGAGLLNQDILYSDARNNTNELSAWYTPPDGLTWIMNDRRPVGFTNPFVLFPLTTEDAISRKLVWTIHHYGVAPMALVFSGDHWVVVHGYEASAAPTNSGDTSYTINAFEINNPWPPVPSFYLPPPPPPHPAPPPHSGTDNCGSGGNRGVANEHINYATWQSTYMTGNVYGSLWNGKNIAVCDPDPPAKKHGELRQPFKRLPGDTLLTPKAAIRYAMNGLAMHELQKRRRWREAFMNAKPIQPVLVHRLDLIDSYYYIVPFERTSRNITAAVAVDARFGDYRQTIALPEDGSSILTALDKEVVLEMTVGRRLQTGEAMGGIMVRKEAFCLYPTLVWQPCLESLSPFWPFHMITVGNQRIYIRVDGKIFTQLHTNIPGV